MIIIQHVDATPFHTIHPNEFFISDRVVYMKTEGGAAVPLDDLARAAPYDGASVDTRIGFGRDKDVVPVVIEE